MIKKFTSVFLLCATALVAQRNSASPYSAFGIGENYSPKTVEQSSMGGIGVANQEYNYLNFVNPAGIAKLRVSTYALGGQTTFLTLKDKTSSQSGHTSDLRYISLGFPLGKKAGFSLGLHPRSSVGYSFIKKNYDGTTIKKTERFKGSGGTNKIYGNFGIDVYKGLSVGIEGAFIFGTIDNSITNTRTNVVFSSKYQSETTVRGGQIKLGLQYKTDISKTLQLSTGIAVKLEGKHTHKGKEQLYSFRENGMREVPQSTLYDRSFKRKVRSPLSVIGGVGIGQRNKWYLAINSEYIQTQENSNNANNLKYEKALKTSIGGYYIPRINSISSYWKRITYRGGIQLERTGLMLDGTAGEANNFTPINDFGINVGLGLPLPKQLSSLNIGFEYGQRGTNKNNLIKENYFNVKLGLSLNSINWFRKREID